VRCGAEISCWPGEWVAILGWLFTLAKWGLLVVGVALPLLLAAIEIGRRAPVKGARASTRALELWRGVVLLRVEIFLVAFFGLALLGGLGWWRWDAGMGIFGLGALLLALVALSVPVRSAAPIGPPVWEHVNPVPVRPFVVGLPLALLGLAMLAAGLPEVISAR